MNVLIIGLGSIAKKHINALSLIDREFSIYALRSNQGSSQYLDVENIYSFDQARKLKLDFAIISSPTSKHLEHINRLVDIDIPLFIEKPLYHTLEVNKVLSIIKAKNISTYVACNLRFLKSLIYVKNTFIEQQSLVINEVNSYCGSYLPDWRENEDYRNGYSAIKELGGGVHLDLIHELDYLYWLFGAPNSVSKLLRSSSSLEIDSIDYANYNLEYQGYNANVILNYYRRDPLRYLEIVFNEFTVKVDVLKNKVYQNSSLIFESKQEMTDTYQEQLQYFIDNISSNSFNDIHEAYEVLKICL